MGIDFDMVDAGYQDLMRIPITTGGKLASAIATRVPARRAARLDVMVARRGS
jgi:hypothetical protein